MMKLSDLSTGSDWILWGIIIVFAIISIILMSGHGKGLIAGYNTASKKEKEKYDAKKLCRIFGFGMAVITVLLVIMGVFEEMLPAEFAYIAAVIILADVVLLIVLGNTMGKKK